VVKVKINLSLCTSWKPKWENIYIYIYIYIYISLRISILGTRWSWVVSFTSRPLWPDSHRTVISLGPRSGLGVFREYTIFCPCQVSNLESRLHWTTLSVFHPQYLTIYWSDLQPCSMQFVIMWNIERIQQKNREWIYIALALSAVFFVK